MKLDIAALNRLFTYRAPPGPLELFGLKYAEVGLPVLPLAPEHTFPPSGVHVCDASSDPDQVRHWNEQHRGANVAIATGQPSGLTALVVRGSSRTFDRLWARHYRVLHTLRYRTRRERGRELIYLYRTPPNVQIKTLFNARPGLSVHGDRHYVIAPPSRLWDGTVYETFISGLAELPGFMIELIAKWREER
jgi:hypothetical protein